MDEENQEEKKQPSAAEQFAKQGLKSAGKKIGKEIGKKGAELLRQVAAKLAALIAANIVPIAIVLAVCVIIFILFSAIDNFLDEDTAETIDEITYQTVNEYCTIDETGIHLDKEEFLKNITVELAKNGIDLNGLGFGNDENSLSDSNTVLGNNIAPNSEAAKYLYKYISAALAGEFPYIPGSDEETQGIIKIKRRKDESEEAKDLTYIGYQRFQDMLKTTDSSVKEEILNYFSLDENWNLCVAKPYKYTVDGTLTTYTVSEVKIPYRNMVAQYTVPFLFLIDLQMVTGNAKYVEAVSELMTKQSEIEFTIFDQITTHTYKYSYFDTTHTKTKHEYTIPVTPEHPSGGTGYWYSTSSSNTSYGTETIAEVDNIKANITKAKTWIIEQETKYKMQETREYPYGESGKTETRSESEPEGEGSWKDPITEYWYEEIIKREWVKAGATKTVITPSEFMGLWSNETGTYVKGAPYLPVGEGKTGKIVEYKLLNGNAKDRPIINIVTAREQLYGLLENSVTTQMHSELMKEMLRVYMNGEELTEGTFYTSAFTSMYEPDEYVEGSYDGDFDVHNESLFITDIEDLEKAFAGGYSESDKLVANVQAFLDMQEKYKVNAIFAAAVSITETSAGRTGNAINGCHNWFNITGKNPHKTVVTKNGETYHWKIYSSDHAGIDAFGNLIANGSYYYTQGNYTVSTIGHIYCPNTAVHPTQADDWVESTLAQIARFYEAIGIDIDPIIGGGGGGR